MAYTFDPALSTLRDRARMRLADTNSADMLLDDATYDAILSAFSFNEALAQLAESIAAAFGRKAEEVQQENVRYSYRSRAKTFMDLARSFRVLDQPTTSATDVSSAAGEMTHPDLSKLRLI